MSYVRVESDQVEYTKEHIKTKYTYRSTLVERVANDDIKVKPINTELIFRTDRTPKRTGVMLVGWGGNNGTTVTAGIIANKNKLEWRTKKGTRQANYFGSITQSSTISLGMTEKKEEIFVPLNRVVPMVHPEDLAIGGWDCSGMNLGDAMRRAAVLDVTLQDALYDQMKLLTPLPSLFDLDFVASNQLERADNIINAKDKWESLEILRGQIRQFKQEKSVESITVLWTASTERLFDYCEGVHDTADNLLQAVKNNEKEIPPSTIYGIAAVLENCNYINGAPQNTLCPGLIELAGRHGVFVGGDDFKSGQTKMKSALVEFFVGAGIKPECIASYNHLGNNDGLNLAFPKQFRSKEITKSNVIDDIVASNPILFTDKDKKPDHCIVIKYLPYVGDSKRAMDEYIFSIFMGGEQTVVLHNTCEDSLLAAPLIIDLVILTELMQRVHISVSNGQKFEHMDTVLSLLSYLLKAPRVPDGAPVVNALNRQKQAIENVLRALIGLPPENNMMLESRIPSLLRGGSN